MIDNVLNRVKEILASNFPSPEKEIITLSKYSVRIEDVQLKNKIMPLILDLDDLNSQVRWHIGQIIEILIRNPHATETPVKEINHFLIERLMPAECMLSLREYVKDADKVIFTNYNDNLRGGTVAGWIIHMYIDSIISRLISIFDRIARFLWLIGKVDNTRNNELVYFRSKKVQKIHDKINTVNSQKILDVSKSELMEFIINYRDELTHNNKQYSTIAGYVPVYHEVNELGKEQYTKPLKWESDKLLGLVQSSYDMYVKTIKIIDNMIELQEIRPTTAST